MRGIVGDRRIVRASALQKGKLNRTNLNNLTVTERPATTASAVYLNPISGVVVSNHHALIVHTDYRVTPGDLGIIQYDVTVGVSSNKYLTQHIELFACIEATQSVVLHAGPLFC